LTTEEEIIGIIKKYISKVEDDFDDYLCYEKYGQKKFLSKGFYPTEEDFEYKKKVIYPRALNDAIVEIKILKDPKEFLEIIAKQNDNSDIKDWASIILSSF